MGSFWQALEKQQQGRQSPARRYLVLHLPRWATDCLRRADPTLQKSERPLALWERQKGAMKIVAVDALAARGGIYVDQNLADARAQLPILETRELDRTATAQVFADFADWHSNASPLVAVLPNGNGYGDLCLDITGVSHLYGSEAQMLETLTRRLLGFKFAVQGAIAATVGAAWGLAQHDPGRIVPGGELADALSNLPVSGLRITEEQISGLMQMGLKRIGQLYGRDRKALAARFGSSLIRRLDQALGRAEDKITPRLPIAERFAERKFAEPIAMIDDVLMTANDLAIQLKFTLEAEGLGAQSFHLFLYRVDHKVMELTVNAGRATRDAGHIHRLFRNRVERLVGEYDPGFGIDMIRLAASSVVEVDPAQLGVFEDNDGTADLEKLYDRMASRLGPFAVLRHKFVNTHIPESAVKLEPQIAKTADDPHAAPNSALARPLRLFPAPEPITVVAEIPDGPPASMIWRRVRYRFAKASGPDRIDAEWWRSGQRLALLAARMEEPEPPPPPEPGKPQPPPPVPPKLKAFDPARELRDYYIGEDDSGRRFWLFRRGLYGGPEAPAWFLQGIFP